MVIKMGLYEGALSPPTILAVLGLCLFVFDACQQTSIRGSVLSLKGRAVG